MTEQEYDEQIAPELARIAKKCTDLGGSFVARVEWEPGHAGITVASVTAASGIGQALTRLAALCNGNLDQLYIEMARRFDLSQTMVGRLIGGKGGVHR